MLKLMTAVGTAGLTLLLNVFHWLFSYEYLQVSFSFDLRQKKFTLLDSSRSWFNLVKTLGTIANTIPSGFLCYYEWKFQQAIYELHLYGTPLPKKLSYKVIASEFANIMLQLVSTTVLGWALKRISNKVTTNRALSLNLNLMRTHITVMALNVVADLIIYAFAEYVGVRGLIQWLAIL